MNRDKILALDLDGTLLNSHKEISPRTLRALLQMERSGATLVISSGRPPHGSRPFAEMLQLKDFAGYVIAFNGAQVVECATGNMLFQSNLPHEVLPHLHRLSQRPSCTLMTYSDDVVLAEDIENKCVQYAANINRLTMRQTENIPAALTSDVPKCIIAGEPSELDKVERETIGELSHSVTITRSEPFFLEIMPMGIDKGAALARLRDLPALRSRQLIAFGDSYNDTTMLALADISVAMQNARPEIRQMAHYTTASNDDDGIATFLEQNCPDSFIEN